MEGPDLIDDVRRSGVRIVETFGLDPSSDPDMVPVDQRALDRLTGTKTPRGPVAVVEIPVEWLDRGRNLLVSVGVSDPGNVGTMIRTAASFGWGFAYTDGSADPWSPKTIRAGGGGQFQTPVAKVGSLDDIGEWETVATTVSGGQHPDTIGPRPVAVLIGEEAHGLDESVVSWAKHRLTIQTPGPTASLNAAVAAGIVVYALTHGSEELRGDV